MTLRIFPKGPKSGLQGKAGNELRKKGERRLGGLNKGSGLGLYRTGPR